MDRMSRRMTSAAIAGLLAAASAAFAAPAPAAAPAMTPLTAEQLTRVDEQISGAEAAVASVEALAKGGPDGSFCPDGVTAQTISRDVKASGPKGSGGILAHAIGNVDGDWDDSDWERYFVCQAVAQKDVDVCRSMPAFDPEHPRPTLEKKFNWAQATAQDRCAGSANEFLWYRELVMKDQSFIERCVSTPDYKNMFKSPAALRKFCGAMFAYDGNPDPVVAAAPSGPSREEILRVIAVIMGDPKQCPTIKDKKDRDFCREHVSFIAAHASGKESDCYGGLCRVLLGKPAAACEDYVKDIRRRACKALYAPRYAEEQTQKFDAILRPVSGMLKNGTGNAATLAGINSRLDQIYALKDRLTAARAKIVPKKKVK